MSALCVLLYLKGVKVGSNFCAAFIAPYQYSLRYFQWQGLCLVLEDVTLIPEPSGSASDCEKHGSGSC